MTLPPTQKFRICLLAATALTASILCSPATAAVENEALPTLQGLSTANDQAAASSATPDASSLRNRVVQMGLDAIGTLYHWGGDDPNEGFDCSGLVHFVFEKTAGMSLPRTARDQHTAGQAVARQQLLPGDLVFFKSTVSTRRVIMRGHHRSLRTVVSNAISHVGIYIGDNQFVHAPVRGERVRVDNLDASYWSKHYAGAVRYLTSKVLARAAESPSPADDADDNNDHP
jgi:cell wall-associated NlpC family hydrolase